MSAQPLELGAIVLAPGHVQFTVWAPNATDVALHLLTPQERLIPMQQERDGYWTVAVDNVPAGSRYWYRLDREQDLPDPASRWQPDGVHGPSAVADPTRFAWHDDHWRGIRLSELVCYELHVGTFTPEGTFTAIIPILPTLVDLGITAIELMPVAEFPGERNWGYDGVLPFAVHHAYGGPDGLRYLVDACHQHGLGVILDVVYNHVGPEGNVLNQYGPYFTERYRTPWGPALNTDGPDSEPVRRFLIENALHWVREYHIDGFRLDAVHAIVDQLPTHILEELAQTLHAEGLRLNRHILVIAESDANDPRITTPRPLGGYGLDAVWSDDFHHALHTLLTGEQHGYYADYGSLEHLARVFRRGFCYTGQRSVFRRRRHGRAALVAQPEQFVVCIQNHDQVGNRARGDRLSTLVDFERLKLAAATVLLSPFTPLLFMGEEYAETAPFPYFVSHTDPELITAVREGRKREFAAFHAEQEPPDPQAVETFLQAKLRHQLRDEGQHRTLWRFYQHLLTVRRQAAPYQTTPRPWPIVEMDRVAHTLVVRWEDVTPAACLALCFADQPQTVHLNLPDGLWHIRVDSAAETWGGNRSADPSPLRITGGAGASVLLPPWSATFWEREDVP